MKITLENGASTYLEDNEMTMARTYFFDTQKS